MSLLRPAVFEKNRFRLDRNVMLTRSISSWVLIALFVGGGVASAAVWAAGRYARTEQVIGRIVPAGAMTPIVPTRPGMVTNLAVKEGDYVRLGEPLATVLVEQASADRIDPAGESLRSVERQNDLLRQQIDLLRQNREGEAVKLDAAIAQYRSQLAAVTNQITLRQGIVQSVRAGFEPLGGLVAKGYYSRLAYEEKRQQLLGVQEQLEQLRAQQAQLAGQLRGAEATLRQLPTQVASKITDLKASQAALLQKSVEVENSCSYVITAPVAGRISALQIAQGSTIADPMPVMLIVSDGAQMMASSSNTSARFAPPPSRRSSQPSIGISSPTQWRR